MGKPSPYLDFKRGPLSYQVLARKYRSQTFDQMIGQNHVTQTLTNALKNNRLPHALVFTGIRGTGKTSAARILAKSIRCAQSIDFKPCGVCTDCLEIAASRSVDVIEIDGASNNGVDSIRDLRDSVMFRPSSGRYKVFIIDEVHMLSTSAFNALLKTLEEPPEHVIFIMATTEVQKIPQTILSRSQRFDFKRIPIKQLTEHLKKICKEEKISIDDKALWLIARQGDGSARDSLSLLDQVINFSSALKGDTILENMVSDILGLTSRSLVFEAFEMLLFRKASDMVSLLHKISQTAVSPILYIEEILKLIRHSILIKSSQGQPLSSHSDMIDLPEEEISQLENLIQPLSLSDLHMIFDMTFKAAQDVSRALDPFLVLEISLLRITQAPHIQDIQNLLSGVSPQPRGSSALSPAQPAGDPKNPKPKELAAVAPEKNTEKTRSFPSPDKNSWYEFVQFIKTEQPSLGAKIENLAFGQFLSESKVIQLEVSAVFSFVADQITQKESQQKLQGLIDSFFGNGYTFQVVKLKATNVESAHVITQQKETEAEEKLKEAWMQDPKIKKAQEVFNGTIKLIK